MTTLFENQSCLLLHSNSRLSELVCPTISRCVKEENKLSFFLIESSTPIRRLFIKVKTVANYGGNCCVSMIFVVVHVHQAVLSLFVVLALLALSSNSNLVNECPG